MTAQKKPTGNRGRPLNLYLPDDDARRLRELATWLEKQSGYRYRVSTSQVVRAVLANVTKDAGLVAAMDSVVGKDGRRRQ